MDPSMEYKILMAIQLFYNTKNLKLFEIILDSLTIDKDLQAQIIKSALETIDKDLQAQIIKSALEIVGV